MNNNYSLIKIAFLASSLILVSCSDRSRNEEEKLTSADTASISINNHQVSSFSKDFTYSFNNNEKKFKFLSSAGKEISLPSGTKIEIPEHCFVDKNGEKVKGEVELSFEEFLTPGSIITSQINMKYDSASNSANFESAGMFRINAFQNGEELEIDKGKSIMVSLASADNDKNFNTYYSEQNGDDWKYMSRSQAINNQAKATAIQTSRQNMTNVVVPVKPVSYSADGKYFDLNLSQSHSSQLNSLIGVVWEYAGTDKNQDPAMNKHAFGKKWDYVNIMPLEGDKRGIYDIVLQNKDTTVKTIARPVFRGAVLDAENEQFNNELGEFNRHMNQFKNEYKQAFAEASFLRVVAVKNLGLYNYDRQYHQDDMTPVLASFDFGADSLLNYPISVYLITGNGMAVIKYPPHDWEKFMYARKDLNKLIAILPNQEICTFSALRFKKEGPVFPKESPGKYTFQLTHTGIKATNSSDIDKVLSTI